MRLLLFIVYFNLSAFALDFKSTPTGDIQSNHALYGLSFHPKKEILFSYGDSSLIKLYNSKSLTLIKTLTSINSEIFTLKISNDGKYLAIGGETGNLFSSQNYIEVWNLETYQKIHSIETNKEVYTIGFNSDNTELVTAGEDNRIIVWSNRTGKKLYELNKDNYDDDNIIVVSFLNNDSYISAISKENNIKTWKLRPSPKLESNLPLEIGSSNQIHTAKIFEKYHVFSITKLERNKDKLTPKWRNFIKFKKYRGGKVPFEYNNAIKTFDISKDYQFMVASGDERKISLRDLKTHDIIMEIKLEKKAKDITINKDNTLIAIISGSKEIKIWKIQNAFAIKKTNPQLSKKSSNKFALVVALDYYANSSISFFNNAVKDAKEHAKILKEKGFKVYSLYNENATKKNIVDMIRYIQKISKKESVLFYFSGHGQAVNVTDNRREGYILPYNFNSKLNAPPLDVMYHEEHAISIKSLIENTMDTKAKHVAILLDSCFSGLAMQTDSYIPINILTAGKDQPVSDGEESSPFTSSINQHLSENKGDCTITFETLAKNVSSDVKEKTQSKQEPQFKINSSSSTFCF